MARIIESINALGTGRWGSRRQNTGVVTYVLTRTKQPMRLRHHEPIQDADLLPDLLTQSDRKRFHIAGRTQCFGSNSGEVDQARTVAASGKDNSTCLQRNCAVT